MNIVLIPTYQEAENIGALLDALCSTYSPETIGKIIVLNDLGSDNTAEVVRGCMNSDSRIVLFVYPERQGLGQAYRDGIRYVRNFSPQKVDKIIFMDADGSHVPYSIPLLLTASRDLVIGSRYSSYAIKKINLSSPYRKLLSRFANWYARKVTGSEIKDLTSGFMCVSMDALRKVNVESDCPSIGHAFVVELKLALVRSGASWREQLITFHARKHGKSKLTLKAIWESILALRCARRL